MKLIIKDVIQNIKDTHKCNFCGLTFIMKNSDLIRVYNNRIDGKIEYESTLEEVDESKLNIEYKKFQLWRKNSSTLIACFYRDELDTIERGIDSSIKLI